MGDPTQVNQPATARHPFSTPKPSSSFSSTTVHYKPTRLNSITFEEGGNIMADRVFFCAMCRSCTVSPAVDAQ